MPTLSSGRLPQISHSRAWKVGAIACAALAVFGSGLSAKSFEDEFAYISQSYYTDLFFEGQFNHVAWLDSPAYDLPPLTKYLIGLSLRACQLRRPSPIDAHLWYREYKPFGPPATLTAARVPIIVVGVLGCLAIFACGVLIKDDRVGATAAILLMFNPLYRLHAHRAMSDIPCETFMLAALWLELWAWRRAWSGRVGPAYWLLPLLSGIAAGLALLSKFNGFLALMIIGVWAGAFVVTPGIRLWRKLTIAAGSIMTSVVALALFVCLNPFMTARPGEFAPPGSRALSKVTNARGWAEWYKVIRNDPDTRALSKLDIVRRFRKLVDHRLAVSNGQKIKMSHNALNDLGEKLKVFVVQGFGRFGLFGPRNSDSTVRYDLRQDWGLIVWGPLVLIGLFQAWRLGRRQFRDGEAPTGIALTLWVAVTWVVVAVYLPMAWDRYLMPPQSVNALLAAMGISAIYDRVVPRVPLVGTRT